MIMKASHGLVWQWGVKLKGIVA